MKKYFEYGEKEIDYLINRDKTFGEVIKQIGHINREVEPDLFKSIVRSIVGQQISTVAQRTIMSRIKEHYTPITPDVINKADSNHLQSLGLSHRKVSYIKEFAKKVVEGEIHLDKLPLLSDEEVIAILTTLKGIGPWTAEMTLLFSMERPNILSYGDLAIQRGLKMIYNLEELSKEDFKKFYKIFSPYASVASLYIWEVAGGKLEKKEG